MKNKPSYGSERFQCPHCSVLSQQKWVNHSYLISIVKDIYNHFFFDYRTGIKDYYQDAIKSFLISADKIFPAEMNKLIPSRISIAICQGCRDFSIWVDDQMVYPKNILVDPPNDDLNDAIKSLYLEASNIFIDSPKGAAALLRLALQKLLIQMGKEGKNINNDIKELVSDGLNPKIQKSLDLVRVIGNNAVHPGQIDIDDNNEIAFNLFRILNIIADEMITKPKEVDKLYDDVIPEEIKKEIEKRDSHAKIGT